MIEKEELIKLILMGVGLIILISIILYISGGFEVQGDNLENALNNYDY